MNIRPSIALFLFLLPAIGLGQRDLSQEQVLEDYAILKEVLTTGHPSLYEYTSESAWDSLFALVERERLPTIQTDNDFYKEITELTDYVRDGHLIVMRPQLAAIPKLFPLWIQILNEQLYTDTDDFGIPVGSEILSIDGISGKELRRRLMKYAPSDGMNTSKKDRQLEREFGILHFYEFGATATYQVEYKTPSGEEGTTTLESQSFESIGRRFTQRNSYAAIPTLGKQEPFVYFIDSLNTAVLTINSFGVPQEQFRSSLKAIFKTIKQQKAEHLIIDIRQNEGGYPENSNFTFSYIAKEPFIQPESQHVITSSLPQSQHSRELINGYTYESFFETYFQQGVTEENRWSMYAPDNEATMLPMKKGFAGQVYVLIGGKTFSAGSTFALNCKNQAIPLYGEETGGGYYLHTGGYPVIYELPHSKINVMMSFVKVNKYVKDETVEKGRGVFPDIEVRRTVEDLLEARDGQLEYILNQIGEQ